MSNQTRLADLLCKLFEVDELRHHLLAHEPGGKALVDNLSSNPVSRVQLAGEAAKVLVDRGLATHAFFENLLAARPFCHAEIAAVRDQWDSQDRMSLERSMEPRRPSAPSGAPVRYRRAAAASIAFHVGLALQPSFGMPVVLLLFLTLPSVRVLFDREEQRWVALVHWIWVGLWLLPSGVALKEMVKLKVDELDIQIVVLFAAILMGLYANIAYLRSSR